MREARHLRLEAARTPTRPSAWDRIVALSGSHKAGWALVAISATVFASLALMATFGERLLLGVDAPIHREVLASRTGWLSELMSWVSLLGSHALIAALLAGVAGWALLTGRCRRAVAIVVVGFGVALALEVALKAAIARPRPAAAPLVAAEGASFPSGHVFATVGFYGALAVVAWKSTFRPSARLLPWATATAIILAVGFSRIYLGVHWFTDVLGALAAGALLVLGVARALRGHHLGRARTCCGAHLTLVRAAA